MLLPGSLGLSCDTRVSGYPMICPPRSTRMIVGGNVLARNTVSRDTCNSFSNGVLSGVIGRCNPKETGRFLSESASLTVYKVVGAKVAASLGSRRVPRRTRSHVGRRLRGGVSRMSGLIRTCRRNCLRTLPNEDLRRALRVGVVRMLKRTESVSNRVTRRCLGVNGRCPRSPCSRMVTIRGRSMMVTHANTETSVLGLARVATYMKRRTIENKHVREKCVGEALPRFGGNRLKTGTGKFIRSDCGSKLSPVRFFFRTVNNERNLMSATVHATRSNCVREELIGTLRSLRIGSAKLIASGRNGIVRAVFNRSNMSPTGSSFNGPTGLSGLVSRVEVRNG